MSPRACPECKSKNTRQMDKSTYGDQAYCLSCYHRFQSFEKIIEPKSVKRKDYSDETNRYLKKACEDIKRMKTRIARLEKLANKETTIMQNLQEVARSN